jgi:hypothetical protein
VFGFQTCNFLYIATNNSNHRVRHNFYNMQKSLEEISLLIWNNCENRPTRRETKPFDEQISQVNIEDLIVYNFLNHPSTALSEFLLATFQFWNHFSFEKWNKIFERIKNNRLAEYYMTVFASQYLSVDPKFESAKDVEIVHFTTADQRYQSGKPALFINNMEGELRDLEESSLAEDFELTINDFVTISDRLQSERF